MNDNFIHDDFEQGNDEKLLHPYGVGIDCHSKFYQICCVIKPKSDADNANRLIIAHLFFSVSQMFN